jgi:hypothetical protein
VLGLKDVTHHALEAARRMPKPKESS